MNESLLNLFCSYHPEFLKSLEIFSEINKKRILKKLTNEQNRNSFLSTIAEIRFGELFSNLNLQIEYDKKYSNKQTPDWSLNIESSTAICEVYRLGKSEKDQMFSDFENQVKEPLAKLKYNYFIKILYAEDNIDISSQDVSLIIQEVEDWLKKSSKVVGDKITVNRIYIFEVVKINTKVNHICFIGPAKSIDYKPHKLKQSNYQKENEITKKLKKYDDIIEKEKLPYFICVYVDFISGFETDDFRQYFLGREVENLDFDTPINETHQFEYFGSSWTELGEFYNNLQLSGIIIFYNNNYSFLINPTQNQIIHDFKNQILKEKLLSINDTKTDYSKPLTVQ